MKVDKPKCWHCHEDHLKKDCPTAPHQKGPSQSKYKLTKERQHNLIKSFCKMFQDRKSQVNKISVPSKNNSFKELNKFFSEFESIMAKDSDNMSASLDNPSTNEAIINEVFIESFHALYKIQIGELHTAALFNTGASINMISFKFYSKMQQQLKILPTSRKVVSADCASLGPFGEVHLKFKIGMVVFNDRFIILNNLQCDIILGLPWQQHYRISCTCNQEGKHFIIIKTSS